MLHHSMNVNKYAYHITKLQRPCVADEPNTLLKLKDLRPSFPYFEGVIIEILPSSNEPMQLLLNCPARKGLTRQ